MSNQQLRQQSVRAVTGTAYNYEEDWHALFDAAGVADGVFVERLLAWINLYLGTAHTNLAEAQYAFAVDQGATSWNALGTFTASIGPAVFTLTPPTLDSRFTFSRSSHGMLDDGVIYPPSLRVNFLTMTPGQLASYGLTFSRGTRATMTGSTGMLTFAPNNLLLNSATLSTQSVTVLTGYHIISFKGSGSVTLTGAASGTVTGVSSSDRVFLKVYATAGSLTVTVSGSVTNARLSAVTYETEPRSVDDVETTGSAYYGPRFNYTSAGVLRGLLIEPARTNRALWSRDLTNAVWVKTDVTAAMDQTGVDGLSGTASRLTATGANGTCLQSITAASAVSIMSCAIKRLVGSGTIEMTTDNGATWTAVTVTSSWTYVEIPAQTVTNPVCGFRIVTSGDSIAVDVVNNETGVSTPATASRSNPIITTSATVTRNADDLSITSTNFSGVYNQTEGTIIVGFSTDNLATDTTLFCIDDGTTGQANQLDVRIITSTSLRWRSRSGGASPVDINPGAFSVGANNKVSLAYKLDDFGTSINGAAAVTDTLGALPVGTMTRLTFGQRGSTGVQAVMHLRSLEIQNTRRSNADLATLSV